MSEKVTSTDFKSESKRMFEAYCNMYDLKAHCCHTVIGENSYKIFLQNNNFEETCELIDDAIRWILKPYRKRSRGQNIGSQTNKIKKELLNITPTGI
jgi:hypothetical protein